MGIYTKINMLSFSSQSRIYGYSTGILRVFYGYSMGILSRIFRVCRGGIFYLGQDDITGGEGELLNNGD